MKLSFLDYGIMAAYGVLVAAIGVRLRGRMKTSTDFFLSGRALPAWVCGIAFIAANLGALEVMGMAANGAKYGLLTAHFYWIGAIPAMIFVGLFMMPFYYGSRARSVPEYLRLRFDEKTRTLNAISFAVMTVLMSGINMYAIAIVLKLMLDWSIDASILLSAGVVLLYVSCGGLTATIYNEVIQFVLMVAGLLPLALLGLREVGGWGGLEARLPAAFTTLWSNLGAATDNAMGVDWFATVAGLGFVLSFGYWCTDFLVVQRAMAARDLEAARLTPLIAAFPKIAFPFFVIVPGLVAAALVPQELNGDYNLALPTLLARYYPPGLLGLGLTALLASFMSGMAGNVTAFNTVWTYDIYQAHIAPSRSDRHYLWVGRVTTIAGIAISVAAAYLVLRFNNLMDYMQLIFSFFNAPLFATFLLGMFWRRATAPGAFWGLLAGTASAALHYWWASAGFLSYASEMAVNFYTAIYAWTVCFLVTVGISLLTAPPAPASLEGLVYGIETAAQARAFAARRPLALAALAALITIGLNVYFW